MQRSGRRHLFLLGFNHQKSRGLFSMKERQINMKGANTSRSSFKLVVVGWVPDPGCKWWCPPECAPGFLVGRRGLLVLPIGIQLRYPNAHMPSSTVQLQCSHLEQLGRFQQQEWAGPREQSALHRGFVLGRQALQQVRITERWVCMALFNQIKAFFPLWC